MGGDGTALGAVEWGDPLAVEARFLSAAVVVFNCSIQGMLMRAMHAQYSCGMEQARVFVYL
jgi:hypothetical protein